MKPLKIAFLGNERHLMHALRAMCRYHVYSANHSQQYTFLLFGDFPQEILKHQNFQFQYIGDDRVDMESFSDDYDLILDPEQDFKPGGELALAQWFEMKLNMEFSPKSAPFIFPVNHFHIRATSFRLKSAQVPIGNNVVIMPPSPQDSDWSNLPRYCPSWWTGAVELLDLAKYSIIYPQVTFTSSGRESGTSKCFDYRFFFTGHEDAFCSRCYMPQCKSLEDLMYHLVNAKMFIGWDNIISDIAASLHVPSIIIRNVPRRGTREVFSVRNDEYILRHIYFSDPVKWDHAKLRQELDFVESRFYPVPRPISQHNRLFNIQN